MRWTVIARAANEQGAGIEAKWANLDQEDAERLVNEAEDGAKTSFTEMFGSEPEAAMVVMVPYIAQSDEPELEV